MSVVDGDRWCIDQACQWVQGHGDRGTHQVLADQLTIFQQGDAHNANLIQLSKFSSLVPIQH